MMSRTDYSAVADAEEICRHKLPSLSPATLQYPMGNCQQQNPPSSLPPSSQTHIQTDLLSGLKRAVEASRSRGSGCWLQIRGWMGEMALLRPPLFVLLRRTTDDCKTCFAIRFLSLSPEENSIDDEHILYNTQLKWEGWVAWSFVPAFLTLGASSCN